MQSALQFLINALSLGGAYALVTLGLALIFGVMRLINFAYGVLIAAGGYFLYLTTGMPWILQAGLVLVLVGMLSVAMDYVAFSPIRNADGNTLLITSFAISYFVQNLLFTTVGSRPLSIVQPSFLSGSTTIMGVTIDKSDLSTIVATLIALVVTTVLLKYTSFGLRLRAASEDLTMMELLGIRPKLIVTAAFLMSGVLAGVASLFYLAKGSVVTPTIGDNITLFAFVAIVLGGMGSLLGAALGGLVLGFMSSFLQAFLPDDIVPFRDALLFGVVILALLVRPQGIIAVRGNEERV